MTVTVDARSSAAPRRRRRVWPWVLGGFLVLVVAAVVVVDVLVRGYAEDLIAGQAADVLEVPDGTPVDVEIGGGFVLLQAVSGSLDHIRVSVGDYPVGPLIGDLTMVAEGVPLDLSTPTRVLTVSFDVPEAALSAISGRLSGVPIDSIVLEEPEIVANGSLSVFGLTVPLGLGLTPSAVDGALAFTPTSIRVGDQSFDAEALASDRIWGGLAGAVLQQQTVCIADQLPAALTITSVAVQRQVLHIELDGSGQALAGDGFSTKGTCAA